MKEIAKEYEFIVVGGGISGVCAALAAARNGVKTALIHDRPVLGGNASSEVRVSINGAGRNNGYKNAIESGLVLELILRNKKVNPQYSFHVLDNVTWEMVEDEENIDLYLNTSMRTAVTVNNRIESIEAYQNTTGLTYLMKAPLFADTTGDANLAYESGADYTVGREAKAAYNESLAPDEADSGTMGSTILYTTKDMGKPVVFKRPKWAYKLTAKDIGARDIGELSNGYWWVEVGGDSLSTIEDAEEIHKELIKYVYGVFDYIKNSGDFPQAANLALDWIGSVPGKRESRRIFGDYVLNQNDIDAACRFEDTIAYGGWTMDDHTIGGIRAKTEENKKGQGSVWHDVEDVYTIPHRCIYSRNIENLYVGGRAISVSHMALSSTRVIGTCAVIGQAVGTSAAVAHKYGVTPRGVNKYMHELQQLLLHDDAYLPGIEIDDEQDIISHTRCSIQASSALSGAEAKWVNSGYTRRIGEKENAWISQPMGENGGWIEVIFEKAVEVNEILLRFDPNFSKYISTRITDSHRNYEEMPCELVRDYKISFWNQEELVKEMIIKDNCVRMNKQCFEKITCTRTRVTILKTYGDEKARICDMRMYCREVSENDGDFKK